MIEVYRAITGRAYYGEGFQNFSGVTLEELDERGIACSNFSEDQHPDLEFEMDDEIARHVGGLPVFLNKEEAFYWLIRKKFKRMGFAVLAVAEIQEAMIESGEVEIIRNGLSEDYDYELDAEMLKQHVTGEKKESGECYIPDYPLKDPRIKETYYIPRAHNLDGTINTDIEEPFIDMSLLE